MTIYRRKTLDSIVKSSQPAKYKRARLVASLDEMAQREEADLPGSSVAQGTRKDAAAIRDIPWDRKVPRSKLVAGSSTKYEPHGMLVNLARGRSARGNSAAVRGDRSNAASSLNRAGELRRQVQGMKRQAPDRLGVMRPNGDRARVANEARGWLGTAKDFRGWAPRLP